MEQEPKPAQTSFFLWMNENRDRFYKPGMSQADVAVVAGDEWRTLPESEKEKWAEKSAKDKERYVHEKAEQLHHRDEAAQQHEKKDEAAQQHEKKDEAAKHH